MDVLKKVILKDLKLNKKRTIVTIIGIILSTALICAVAGMVTSVRKSLIEYEKQSSGNYHVTFENVPKDDLKYIENNINIDTYYLSENLGYSILNGSENESKPYISVMSASNDYLNNMGIKLVEGRLPENSSEIIISEYIIKDANVQYKIGDKITLDVSKRMIDGYELNQNNPYDVDVKETLEKKFTKKYKIVGIMERLDFNKEPYDAPGYTVITKMDEVVEKANISVLYKNVLKYGEYTKQINNENQYNTYTNDNLLDYEGVGLSDRSITTILRLAIIVIVIIMVSSIFVIRNSFAISITERMKQYGMLASIGATSKQIKKSVIFESFILGIIAIQIGILSGILAVFILVNVVNLILSDILNGIIFIYDIPILPIIIAIILSAITIYLSALGSARKASKISPMELIRSNQDIKIKSKKVKSPKFVKKIFGIGGDIAYKNLKRNRKRYRTTIISIIVSIVIFISLSSFIEYAFTTSMVYYTEMGYNLEVNVYNNENDEDMNRQICDKISKLDNIEEMSITNRSILSLYNTDCITDFAKDYFYDTDDLSITIVSLDSNYYEKYVKEIGGNVEDYSKGAILINDFIYYDEESKPNLGEIYTFDVGTNIEGEIVSNQKKVNIPVVAITTTRPMGFESVYSDGGYIVVREDMFENLDKSINTTLYIKSSDSDKLEEDINNLNESFQDSSSELNVWNVDEEVKSQNAIILVISIFLYGFIAVIILIGITNIFNTLTTTMNLRRKEFAMLKSVGMTSKEFDRMIGLESLFYGFKALIIGIPIGILLSYLIYDTFANSLEMTYTLPINAIIISVVFVFIVIGIIMKVSLNKLNKQNIIETIREDNV